MYTIGSSVSPYTVEIVMIEYLSGILFTEHGSQYTIPASDSKTLIIWAIRKGMGTTFTYMYGVTGP